MEKRIQWLSTVSAPGLDGVPVFNVASFFIGELKNDRILTRAKSIAYSFFLALFPAIIFLFSLIPYIPVEGFQESLLEFIYDIMPTDGGMDALLGPIADIIYKPQSSLLSVSLILTLFFSTNGVIAIMDSFDKTKKYFKQRNFLQARWVSLKLTLILFVLFVATILLIIGGKELVIWIQDKLDMKSTSSMLLFEGLRFLITVLLLFFSIGTIYRYAPATTRNWGIFSPGATLATVLSIVTSSAFSYYLANFGSYNQIYGSIAAIIIILIWLYINALVLLIGFELNVSIYYHKSLLKEGQD